jgi:putative FmdB family regulatory protein
VPNYEYQCKTCEHRFEIWQAVGEAPPPCEKCGAEVKKIFQPPRLHFKGSGFYVTDLAAEKKSRTKASETKSETKTEATAETKSETATPASDAKSDSSGPGNPTAATT